MSISIICDRCGCYVKSNDAVRLGVKIDNTKMKYDLCRRCAGKVADVLEKEREVGNG